MLRCASNPASRPDPIGYTLKRLILGRPLVTAQLRSDGLSNPVALGVLSPDAISSNAYGVEEILIELLPFAGLAAVTLLLPITGVVLLILVFSNGIIALTVLAVALLVVTGGSVNALVPFYAIGVFTGFAMAGYGMTKHHVTQRESGWRYKFVINFSAGVLSTVVVGIFAVAKFAEGVWLVVVIFPLLVLVLIRPNREYRAEAAILERFRTDRPDAVKYARRRVMVFVHSLDLAVLEVLRYGKGLHAVKFHAGRDTDIAPGDVVVLMGKARQNGNEPVYMSDPSYRMVGSAEEPEGPE